MGKIIEFKSDYALEIGTVLWMVGVKKIRKFRHCPMCNSRRTIKVYDNAKNEYEMKCPHCCGVPNKYGVSADFKHFSVIQYEIEGFSLSKSSCGEIQKLIRIERVSDNKPNYTACPESAICSMFIVDSEQMIAKTFGIEREPMQVYFRKKEAEAEVKRLNIEQEKLIDAFLRVDDEQNDKTLPGKA